MADRLFNKHTAIQPGRHRRCVNNHESKGDQHLSVDIDRIVDDLREDYFPICTTDRSLNDDGLESDEDNEHIDRRDST